MACGAMGVGAVLLQALAACREAFAGHWLRQRRRVRRRRRRRIVQQRFQHPFSALYGRSPVGIGGNRQDAGLGEQAAAVVVWTEPYSLKALPVTPARPGNVGPGAC